MVGTTPRSPLCRHGFQRGSRLLPNSRGLERLSSFLIAARFSGRWQSNTMRSVRMWSNREIISHVQDSLRDTHTLMSLIPIHPSHVLWDELSLAYLRGQMVPRACLPTHSGNSRICGELFADGRDRWMSIVAFMVADRHIVATMELLPQNFYRDRTGRYKAFQHIGIFIFE